MDQMESAYCRVKESIVDAANRSHRDDKEITLIAVSKYGTLEQVHRLTALGQLDFGENRVQALMQRMEQCDEKLRWHCIGQLQSNKVKYIINHVQLIHSLDRLNLAREMEKQTEKSGTISHALIQVRFDEQAHRGGIAPHQVRELLDGCAAFSHLCIEGLMCVAPLGADESQTRTCFASLQELFENLSHESWPNVRMKTLSMGMSRDYPWAIEHGATMVRIGSALFDPGV